MPQSHRPAGPPEPSAARAGLSLVARIRLAGVFVAVAMVAMGVWLTVVDAARMEQERRSSLSASVELATMVVRYAHDQETGGQMDRAHAQALAIAEMKAMQLKGDGYFWINDMTPRVLMHTKSPALVGQEVSGVVDPTGLPVFKVIVDTVRAHGHGFVDYLWPRAAGETPEKKISYVQGFEPWGWVVGSGLYVRDLDEARNALLAQSMLVVGVAVALVWAVIATIVRRIRNGLAAATGAAARLAGGDFGAPVPTGANDEIGRLMHSMERMRVDLRALVSSAADGSSQVRVTAGELTAASAELATRVEHAATQVQQATSLIATVGTGVGEGAELAGQAGRLAAAAHASATGSSGTVRQAVATMKDIHDASRRVQEIVGVIDGIAFQTNILALNASVEAAKAGDQGRGFAVVAGEVRSLAQRSATASREIRKLIDESTGRIEAGSRQVGAAGAAMDELAVSIARINALSDQILANSGTRVSEMHALQSLVDRLDDLSGQNAASVEQSAAAAASLDEQAVQLARAVAVFRL